MNLIASAPTLVLVLVTVIVLWLGKAMPKLISKFRHEVPILTAYLLIAAGWLWALSLIAEAHLFTVLGNWRSAWLLWGLLLGPALFVVSGMGYAVVAGLGSKPPAEAAVASVFQGFSKGMLIVLVITLALLEEWLFRGVMLDFLLSRPVALAVIGSAVLFALYHLSLFQFLPTLLLGLGLALTVVYFGAVWPAVVAHALFNVIGVLIATTGRYTGGTG